MWLRLGTALAGMAVCATACAVLWPHAREAGTILAAQDDPTQLSDLQLDSALRNDKSAIERNIEAALAAGDADLAKSFVDLAGAKDIAISEQLSRRVTDAVAQENSASLLPSSSRPASSPAMPTMSRACPARSLATCSCSATSVTWSAKASIWRWARIPTAWCWALPRPASR